MQIAYFTVYNQSANVTNTNNTIPLKIITRPFEKQQSGNLWNGIKTMAKKGTQAMAEYQIQIIHVPVTHLVA